MPNPNPPLNPQNLTAPRFQPGQSGNPGGKTSKQRKMEVKNAEKATVIRGKLLDALADAMKDGARVEHIESNVLRLIKDSEDRGLGSPIQPHEVTNQDAPTIDASKLSDKAIEELLNAQSDTGGSK